MGNTHSSKTDPFPRGNDRFLRQPSPPLSPRSPLTYSPQIPMVPLASKATEVGMGATASSATELSPWITGPKLMPVVIVWNHGGHSIEVEGSFDNWTTRQPLQNSGNDFMIIKLLAPGVYQYKFIIDGEWKYDPNQPAMFDEMGNVNNVIEVHEYVPENLDTISAFDSPPSPPSSYDNPPPAAEDYEKEPSLMPQHLQLTLLNVKPALEDHAVLPRPQHVILNHLYCQRGQNDALVIGVTHRYKSKYTTVVLYRPNPGRAASGAATKADGQ